MGPLPQVASPPLRSQSALFMRRRLEQIHKEIKTSTTGQESSACSLFPGMTMFVPGGQGMQNTKTGIGQVSGSYTGKLTLFRSLFYTFLPQLGVMEAYLRFRYM